MPAILAAQAAESPILGFTLALFGVLLWKTKQLRSVLEATGKKIVKIRTDKFVFTLQALGLTLLLAAPWPLLLAVCGWQIAASVDATDFAKAVARGLLWARPNIRTTRGHKTHVSSRDHT